MLLMEVLKCWKIVGFPKISIKMKDFKIFYGAQTLIYKIIQPPTRQNFPRLWNKVFFTELYWNI